MEDGTLERRFYVAPVDSFESSAVMIPDIGNNNPAAYLKMAPQKEWADQFVRWMATPHTRDFTED